MPKPVAIPAQGDVEYTYEIVPTDFAEDRWVQMSEIRPIEPAARAPRRRLYSSAGFAMAAARAGRRALHGVDSDRSRRATQKRIETTSDMLLVYAPGSSPDQWPDGMAKFVPAGSDLVFQMHYTTNGTADGRSDQRRDRVREDSAEAARAHAATDQSRASSFRPELTTFAWRCTATLPNDATLLSFFPHMHLRGKRFEYNIVHDDGSVRRCCA